MIRERGKEEIVAFGTTVRLLLEPKPVRGSTMKGTSEMSSFFFFFFLKRKAAPKELGWFLDVHRLISTAAGHRVAAACRRSGMS